MLLSCVTTSSNKVMFYPAFVRLSVHQSVCLLPTSRKSYRMDLHQTFTNDIPVYKEKLIKFCKSSASTHRSGNFLKNSSTLQDMAFFHNLVFNPGKTFLIFMKILSEMYLWVRKFPPNLESHPDLDLHSESRLDSTRPRCAISKCSCSGVCYLGVCHLQGCGSVSQECKKYVIQLLKHKLLCVIREYEVCLYRSTELHHGLR